MLPLDGQGNGDNPFCYRYEEPTESPLFNNWDAHQFSTNYSETYNFRVCEFEKINSEKFEN